MRSASSQIHTPLAPHAPTSPHAPLAPTTPHPPNTLTELAERYGVQPSFVDNDGRVHRAEDAVIVAILAALGAPIDPGPDGAAGTAGAARADIADALAERRHAQATNPLEPVLVHRVGRAASAEVTLPAACIHVMCGARLRSNDGQVRRQRLIPNLTSMHAVDVVDGPPGNRYRFRLDQGGTEPIGPGYHRVTVEWPGTRASALLIAAPRCPPASRGWGLFLPLHALRTEQDWGVGSYADMAELGQWAGEMGASMLGALPLYPAFLDPPADPSPYLPVSRLAYNEVFIDPTVLPELAAAPEARRLLDSDEFVRQLKSAHSATLVDYETVSHLRRQVLTPMAEALLSGGSARRDAFCAWVDAHPELLAYARFRAAGDRLGHRPGMPVYAANPVHADPADHADHRRRTHPGVPLVRPVGRGRATDRRRVGDTALRRSPHRRPSRWVRPRLGARCLRAGGTRGRATRLLLRRRAGLGVSSPPPRADTKGRLPLLHRRAAAGLPSRRLPARRSHHGTAAALLDPGRFRRPPRRVRLVPGGRAPCGGRPGGAPGGRGRRGRGPGHGPRRGAGPHGRGSHAALLGPPVRIERRRPDSSRADRRAGLVGHPRSAPLRCVLRGGRHRPEGARRPRFRPSTPLPSAPGGRTGAARCSGPWASTRSSTHARRRPRPARPHRSGAPGLLAPSRLERGGPRPGRPRGPVGGARAAEPAGDGCRRRQLATPGRAHAECGPSRYRNHRVLPRAHRVP